jgi:acetyltransferase-like isoleucine patch superfamily enzyme
MSEDSAQQSMGSDGYPLAQLRSVGSDVRIHKIVEIRNPHMIPIGSHVAIDFGFFITSGANIGDYIHIGPHVTSIGGVNAFLELESLSSVAAGVRFICLGDEHLGKGIVGALIPKQYQDNRLGGKIVVEKFAALGTNSIVMPGFTVSEGSVVGANSLLRENTEPYTIYAGSPAKPIRNRPKEGILRFAKEMGYTSKVERNSRTL